MLIAWKFNSALHSHERNVRRDEWKFISSRLLSLTYKSHIQNFVVFFGQNRLGQRARVYETRDFIGKHSGNIEYPFSALTYSAHAGSSIFIHVAFERNISRRLFFSIASRIFTSRRDVTAVNENASSLENFRIEIITENVKF